MSPALLDYTCILDQEPLLVSHYYTAYAIGNIIGSLCKLVKIILLNMRNNWLNNFHLVGFLFKYINRQLTLVVALTVFGLTTLLMPTNPNLVLFYFFGLVSGIGAGCLDIVQTAWLIEMWSHKSGSILQLSEFCYGLGIIIGPQLVGPFLFDNNICDGNVSLNHG